MPSPSRDQRVQVPTPSTLLGHASSQESRSAPHLSLFGTLAADLVRMDAHRGSDGLDIRISPDHAQKLHQTMLAIAAFLKEHGQPLDLSNVSRTEHSAKTLRLLAEGTLQLLALIKGHDAAIARIAEVGLAESHRATALQGELESTIKTLSATKKQLDESIATSAAKLSAKDGELSASSTRAELALKKVTELTTALECEKKALVDANRLLAELRQHQAARQREHEGQLRATRDANALVARGRDVLRQELERTQTELRTARQESDTKLNKLTAQLASTEAALTAIEAEWDQARTSPLSLPAPRRFAELLPQSPLHMLEIREMLSVPARHQLAAKLEDSEHCFRAIFDNSAVKTVLDAWMKLWIAECGDSASPFAPQNHSQVSATHTALSQEARNNPALLSAWEAFSIPTDTDQELLRAIVEGYTRDGDMIAAGKAILGFDPRLLAFFVNINPAARYTHDSEGA